MNVVRKFRNVWKFLVPGWLQEGEGETVQFVQGLVKDAFAERCTQTAYLHYPSTCASDALAFHGRTRALPRGLFEPEDQYRLRLAGWRYPKGHRVRGTAGALLAQFQLTVRATFYAIVDARTQWFTTDSGFDTSAPWQWGAMPADQWARYWLVCLSSAQPWASFSDPDWLAAWGDPNATLAGNGITSGEIAAVKTIVRNDTLGWTPAGVKPQVLTIYFGSDPLPVPGSGWDDFADRDTRYRYEPLSSGIQ